jgi:hypothetical protein
MNSEKRNRLVTAASLMAAGALAGGLVGFSNVSFETVIYSWQETEAQLFFSSESGSFADDVPLSEFVDMGSNRVSFALKEDHQRESFVQRLDPCECPWGIAVGRVGLASPFSYQEIEPDYWITGGSTESLVFDRNMQLLQLRVPETDPQLLFYLDVQSFIEQSTLYGAIAGGIAGLFIFGLGLQVFLAVRRRRGVPPGDAMPLPGRGPPTRARLLVVWVTGLLIVLGVGQMVWGAYSTGITIDEGYHVGHLQNFLDGADYSTASYGPVASLVGHALNVGLGLESWGAVSSEPAAFAGRHLAIALLGILAIGAVGLTVGVTLRSVSWGMVGAAILATLPLWVGHSMFNLKDVPAGAGYALFIAGLAWLLVSPSALWLRLSLGGILVGVGIAVGVGTRPGLWPLFLATGVALLAAVVLKRTLARTFGSAAKRKQLLVVLASIVGAGLLGAGALFFTEAGRSLVDAVSLSLDYPWSKSRRYDGVRVYNRPEALLVFRILLSQIPAFVAFLFAVGTVTGIAVLWMDVKKGVRLSGVGQIFPLAALQVFTPFVVLAVFNPVLYDGIRQILFVLPGVAIISAFGLWGLYRGSVWLFGFRQQGAIAAGVASALLFSIVMVDQVRLFPYNYVYVNAVAQENGASGAWESDYWDSSMREAIRGTVAVGDPITCGFTHQAMVNISAIRPPCITISPYLPYLAPSDESNLGDREFWTIRSERNLLQYGPPPSNCFPESAVTRQLRSETLVLSRLYRCVDY